MTEPENVILASPLAAVLGAALRSPVSVLTANPLILPLTDTTRCTLLTFLVVWLDCWSRVAASGSGPLDFFEEEQPPTKAVAMLRVARTARSRRRVRICAL